MSTSKLDDAQTEFLTPLPLAPPILPPLFPGSRTAQTLYRIWCGGSQNVSVPAQWLDDEPNLINDVLRHLSDGGFLLRVQGSENMQANRTARFTTSLNCASILTTQRQRGSAGRIHVVPPTANEDRWSLQWPGIPAVGLDVPLFVILAGCWASE